MKSVVTRSLLLGAALALAAPLAQAVPITFTTSLSGAAEEPPNNSPGTGSATVIFDAEADSMRVIASFSGLLAGTTAAHVHCCTDEPGSGTAGVATEVPFFEGFPIGVTSGNYDNTFDTTEASTWNPDFVTEQGSIEAAEAAFAEGLASGTAYFNVHSSLFPAGEIRGFLEEQTVAVPTPGPLALLGFGLAGIGLMRARGRH